MYSYRKISMTVAGLALCILPAACISAGAGGKKVLTSSIAWKEIWRGSGPSWSPTGTPPGLTVVRTKEAWMRLVKPYGPPLDELVNLPVDWKADVLLWIEGYEADPAAELHVKSISAGGSGVTVTAELQTGPPGQPSLGTVARPWVVATIAAKAAAKRPEVAFVLNGRNLPVRDER
jgi:hypothetical protein